MKKIAFIKCILFDKINNKNINMNSYNINISNCDYFLFTNNKNNIINNGIYTVKEININKNINDGIKYIKWSIHKYISINDYDIIIWSDFNIIINNDYIEDINILINEMKNDDFDLYMLDHKFKSVKDDLIWSIKNKKINEIIGNNVEQYLLNNEYSSSYELVYSSSFFIINTKILLKLTNDIIKLFNTICTVDNYWIPYLIHKYKLRSDNINKKFILKINDDLSCNKNDENSIIEQILKNNIVSYEEGLIKNNNNYISNNEKDEIVDKKIKNIISKNNNKIKVAYITSIFIIELKDTDKLNTKLKKIDEWDYFVFTNNKDNIKNPGIFNVIDIDTKKIKYGLYATKRVKWLTHKYLKDYDVIIWTDSFIDFDKKYLNDIKEIIQNVYLNPKTPIYLRTQQFKNVDEDINWCLDKKRINQDMVTNIKSYLKLMNFPSNKNSKTYWSSVIIKTNKNENLNKMQEEIVSLVENVGYRDQHWLPYLFNKYNIIAKLMPNESFIRLTENYNHKNHHYINIIK
jgi:hypothetical protein